MESKYDCKFEEMKKYIPFLENMITRLESSSTPSSNPRQAQLDKIRSLRDLLSNKKKRMKMENLLKCEQVLINLYAKVEQRDKKTIDSGFSIDTPTAKEKSELEAVRNKLKTVVQRQENLQDTLPEILPRSEVDDEHTSGTKEPALFQRRPNQQSGQTSKETEDSLTTPPNSASKRNYTRVLVSPESSTRHARWSSSESTAEKPLFSRRSPRKSPRRHSPSYHKKERKKSKDKQSRKRKDLNITLNVPEESLNSLNTKDILSRIIHCSDGDVDIDTLRELKKQILDELQKTGAKDDISDLILKSYNKSVDKTKAKKPAKKEEIEEGELSDSESEAIESIYGSLVVKEPGQTKPSLDKDTQPRKIQICLVINSDNKSEEKVIDLPKQDSTDFAELEMYENEDKKQLKVNEEEGSSKANDDAKKTCETSKENSNNIVSQTITKDKIINTAQDIVINPPKQLVSIPDENSASTTAKSTHTPNECEISTVKEATQFKANFYKPLTEPTNLEVSKSIKNNDTGSVQVETDSDTIPTTDVLDIESTLKQMDMSSEIPLLHERTIDKQPPNSTLSEIDILQALKKEILSEITVPGTESTTPPLHQPKIMKVANAQANQILPKKRISIEKYKEKSVTSLQQHLNQVSYKEEQMKKTSLKLTDKECERFFNVPTISFGEEEDESLDENDDGDIQANDVYGDLAPKSPDNEDFSNTNSTPPVIIPMDPIKNVPTNNETDVDMRAIPLISPNSSTAAKIFNSTCTSSNNEVSTNKTKNDIKTDQGNSQNRPVLVDPRVRRDLNPNISTRSPNPHASNPERTPRQIFTGVSSSTTSNSIMTPNSRSYEMTPTHQSFEIDQPGRKHVYVPTMTSWDREKSVPKDIRSWENTDTTGDRKSLIDESRESCWNPQKEDISQNSRFNSDKYGNGSNNRYAPDMTVASTQSYARKEAPMTPLPSFGRSDCPSTPSHPFGRLECPSTPSHPFGRLECPTPSHPFGRYECPPTPNHSFGRLECPPTPSHSFGRLECPPTPNHSFGRLECPSTPSHPFGRRDCPPTPNHPFGRSDCPSTPSHPFGRSEGLPPLMLGTTDCSKPPSNSYIGPDCPSTSAPLFGRNECRSSQTQKHSYGRSEPLKSQYGRSDFCSQNYTKDPRLNRKLDTESKSQYDERDRSYYKDQDRYRGSSYSSQKYSGSSSYRHYERDANRNSKYKYFAPEQSGRQFNKDQERRDHVVDRSISKDRESSATYFRDRSYDSDGRRYEEVGSRREYREKSIGRNMRLDERSPSASKNNPIEPERNTLSIKSNTGRSFTIDTSINATFQKIIDSANEIQGFVNNFDMRRQRAASVGRSLTRESSVGRIQTQPLNSYEKKKAFQRASSVGRELVDSNKDKRSFQEIKADFKSCSFSGAKVCTDKNSESRNSFKPNKTAEQSANSKKDVYEKQKDGQRGRSESIKQSYSPRKNSRDPRMRKLTKDKTDRFSSDNYSRRSGIVYSNDNIVTGSIMASGYGVKNYKIPKIKRAKKENEDNLEKTDTTCKNDDKEKPVIKDSDNITEKGCSKEKLHINEQRGKVSNDIPPLKVSGTAIDVSKKVSESIDTGVCTERRRTRSSIRSKEEADADVIGKMRKCKKVIYDSDSDDALDINSKSVMKNMKIERKNVDTEDSDQKSKAAKVVESKNTDERKDLENEDGDFRDKSVDSKNKKISEINKDIDAETEDITTKNTLNSKAKLAEHISPVKDKINRNLTTADLSSNFGIDELEMFSDNIVSDPVLDNISALIADLDNDLSSSRSDLGHNFTKEISLENMMQNISSPEKTNLMDNDDDSSKLLAEIDKISKDQVEVPNNNQIKDSLPMNKSLVSFGSETNMRLNKVLAKNIIDESCLKDICGNLPSQSDALRNEEKSNVAKHPSLVIAINEHIDSTTEGSTNEKPVSSKLDEQNIDGCSTPDSTINTDDALLKSTNDESLPGSTNEVTSTELIEGKPCTTKEMAPALDSIGSLLSILQDKSKIKELLLMLGDQSSENEKIKKKLEKLSEIVSDDEESCDVPSSKLDQTDIDKLDVSETSHENIDKTETIDEMEMETIDNESLSKDSSLSIDSNQNNSKIDDAKTSDIEDDMQNTNEQNIESKPKKKPGKKTKYMKKARGKPKKVATVAVKRITRATVSDTKAKIKKPPRELMQLQEDIKEMFIRDDVLSATGIRMCRLAKLVDEKTSPAKEEPILPEVEPVVVLQKFKDTTDKNCDLEKSKKKKTGPKIKVKGVSELAIQDKTSIALKHKPGPKSKTKTKKDSDPYVFESDSFSDTITEKTSEAGSSSDTDSESSSLTSSKSFGSTELLADLKKKPKRRRRGWQAGVIKTKTKKKKIEPKPSDIIPADTLENFLPVKVSVLDTTCFTDRNYCFRKNVISYSCRLCKYTGYDIVLHYRNKHPHVVVPLSRMPPDVAKEAIEQCQEINFQAISNIPSDKYICTFCYKEFPNSKSVLETFFWHIVSTHTGEYKQHCSQCDNMNECPFNLDIPPPPKDAKGQLIGFICKKCNFTQISLENLKTHIILHHNDEQTAVYRVNLSIMTKKSINSLLRRSEPGQAVLQTSTRRSLDHSVSDLTENTEREDNEGVRTRTSARKATIPIVPPIQSKITFEGDDISEVSDVASDSGEGSIKLERTDSENADAMSNNEECLATDVSENDRASDGEDQLPLADLLPSSDIMNYPHFKISLTESGTKEYFCCINGNYHFKTTLLISMKKHVKSKHSEPWEGYCFVCKVIVTPQGVHSFSDCWQHYLDKHMDNFPIFEKALPAVTTESPAEDTAGTKPYINVRPLSELITRTADHDSQKEAVTPVIQSVTSLGTSIVESPRPSPTYAARLEEKQVASKVLKYEEHQAEVLSKKYYLVVQDMMVPDKLVKIFKCAGVYCKYATDSTEEALAHATTHQRIGGVDALNCCYCDFDSAGNAVDLVMHVFKSHGNCRYCCEHCFYRAASSQAVGAHSLKVHGKPPVPGSVLRTETVSSLPITKVNILTRQEAVSYYVCGHSEHGEPCKFRTYTPDKFCEHLLQRHAAASAHPCNLCPVHISTATELVQHMKIHGLKLYQCTWCVHGADNESEMLTHVSTFHPDKQPQAYIRIITNKDGSNALRVLPLAFLTKNKVPIRDVIPSTIKDHPVREAERSTEMEALIGPFMADPMDSPITSQTDPLVESTETPIQTSEIPEELIEPPEDIEQPVDIEPPEDIKPVVNVQLPEPITQVPQLVQPPSDLPSTVTMLPPTDSPLTPLPLNPLPISVTPIKKEPSETVFTDIVVLDSDEEEISNADTPSVIDVSDDEASTSSKKDTSKIIPMPNLFMCPQCRQIFKNMGGFKKHLLSCVSDPNRALQCPHCTYMAENLDKITWHYVVDHTKKSTYKCGLCGALLVSENFARKHMKSAHKQTNVMFTKNKEEGTVHFTVTVKEPLPKEKILPKRKLSGPKTDPIPAKRRFEPHEIDQLPITPILDQLVYCSRCEFSTKVRLNMVRHLQLHAEQQPVPQTAPVNPVPHLESNEKHFDKMVNLASSSVVNRTPDKPRQDHTPSVTLLIPPEAAARYPKYVSERQRHTCGAKGCSYISVDEAMLRRHWDALHSGSSDFHCVHCPPHQHLDTSKPLTALRIVSHLKMHDSTLYACSSCSYYHFRREAAEKHVADAHENARVLVVREEHSAPVSPAPVQSTSAPTMDLKPWQCGLCKFKSMLRPEVVDHCSKVHQSKMQFKCAYCPFRTSAIENISKHQTNSHVGKSEEVFYYYYRVGSIPDDNDGTPLWVKQRQKAGPSEPEVKVEAAVSPVLKSPPVPPVVPATPLAVDLNLVKKEVNETSSAGTSNTMEDLCNQFGQFSEPNGIKYKCPLCAVVMEETRELMQSHLYEELNYRKWSCGLCSYKAFHKAGLTDHMTSEHRRQYDHIELPTNVNIERWVTGVLDHQASVIDKRKENLQKQRIQYIKPVTESAISKETAGKYPEKDLEQAFGTFGLPDHTIFCCPKCKFLSKNETVFRDHLEMELNKVRWCCTVCPATFYLQHEARLHCKSHDGPSWPKEAIRDPAMRVTWISTVIEKQKNIIQNASTSSPQTSEASTALQKSVNDKPVTCTESAVSKETATIYPEKDLEQAFGAFGLSKGIMFSCPKCDFLCKDKTAFRDHLEMELNKIRWCCTHCPENFQTYHEARFHGKGHDGPSWPKEAIRDPAMRATWVSTTIEKQKQVIQNTPTASSLPPTPEKFVPDSDNSLLVVRYEMRVPTPDQVNVRRKRAISDSDEEKLVIDEPVKKKEKHCPHCDYKSIYSSSIKVHMLTHFGLKPYSCSYCSFDSYTKKAVAKHIEQTHSNKPVKVKMTELPPESKKQDDITLICLVCEKSVREVDTHTHLHNNVKPEFSESLIVNKCGICSSLCRDSASLAEHQQKAHPGEPIQYSLYTLGTDTFICLYCDSKFQYLKDYRAHHMASHPALRFTVTSSSGVPSGGKAESPVVFKRCARKSTTKLPNSVARKSTTKLPYSVSSDDEYSYYGTEPPPLDQYSNVTTLMSFCNRMVPFSLKQLSEHLNIEPRVLVSDVRNSSDLKFNL